MRRSNGSRALAALAAALWLLASLAATGVRAADPVYPDRLADQHVFDTAGALNDTTRANAEQMATSLANGAGVDIVVYTRTPDDGVVTPEAASADAQVLADQWAVDLAIVADVGADGVPAEIGLATPAAGSSSIDPAELDAISAEVDDWLASGDLDSAVTVAMARAMVQLLDPNDPAGVPEVGVPAAEIPTPGPPFPDPVDQQAVYDFAGILSPEAIVDAESTIDAIEARTGAEVVVYSQLVDYGVTTEETEARARALIDQWGVGRKGFDDGLAIFFDIDPSRQHGQVQLYAAPGFEATYLSSSERQAIFDNDMLPHLRDADFDGALAAALDKVDAAATTDHAATLQAGRQINAVLGLVGAPIVFLGLSGWAFFHWRRFGKDPVYLDDPSILMPAPPPDLTAASGAFVMDGGTSRRALTTAMLDLASRGQIAFREEKGMLGLSKKVGVDTNPPPGDPVEEAHRSLNSRRPTGPAEAVALQRLRTLDGTEHYIEPDDLPKFGAAVASFDSALEQHVVDRGWMVERPSKVVSRWVGRGAIAIGLGALAIFLGFNVPISGLVLLGGAAIAGGIVIMLFAQGMPSVTMPGAMIRAMLAAYRRTLEKTMEQARSMQQVVDEAKLDWLVTPDQAVVWGTALGLQSKIDDVLSRSIAGRRGGSLGRVVDLVPGLVHELGRLVLRECRRGRQRRVDLLGLGRARPRRHDVGPRDDRELAGVVGRERWRRVQRWRRGRRWRWRRRRLLGAEQLAAGVEALDGHRRTWRDRHCSTVSR